MHYAGGRWSGVGTFDDVLEYDEEMQIWKKIGSMSIKKRNHAITVVNYNSIKDYCN